MKKNFSKIAVLLAAVVLLAGAASGVAYARSGQPGKGERAAVCRISCYPDKAACYLNGGCPNEADCPNALCAQDGTCLNGCGSPNAPCAQDGTCLNGCGSPNAPCAQDGTCLNGCDCPNAPCAQDGTCLNGCGSPNAPCAQNGAVCGGLHHTEGHAGHTSGHHSGRGCR